MELFGLELKRKKVNGTFETFQIDKNVQADAVIDNDSVGSGGTSVFGFDAATVPAEEQELINTYRSIALSADIDEALQEIRNEVLTFDVEGKRAFELNFKDSEEITPLSDSIKKKIQSEFANVYQVTDFHRRGIKYFDDWYIDSKLYIHKIVDNTNPGAGIKAIVQIDPLKMRRIKVVPKPDNKGIYDVNKIEDIYIFAQNFDNQMKVGVVNQLQNYSIPQGGLKIAPEAIAYSDSTLIDRTTGRVYGYLRKAIIPFNSLRMMEDAMLIFRVVRAPMRRAIYVDVGGLQKNKADQYMKDMMSRFKNKMVFDTKTGTLADRRNIMSMMEDYWLPRRDGTKGTEISNLEGQSSQDVLEEVEYNRDKLWRSLNVPRSRFGDQAPTFMFGKGVEIQRDEYRFKKFLNKIRNDFLVFFEDILKTQLILKKVITFEDWPKIRDQIYWDFTEDNAFVEFKESEILNNRLATLQVIEPFVGKYFTIDWVKTNVLHQTDGEKESMKKQMALEPAPIQEEPDVN